VGTVNIKWRRLSDIPEVNTQREEMYQCIRWRGPFTLPHWLPSTIVFLMPEWLCLWLYGRKWLWQ